jgi:hypothetical protein
MKRYKEWERVGLWKGVQDGVENSIRSYHVFVTEVIVGGGFFVDMKQF